MAYTKYESEFYSANPASPDSRFKVMIHKKTGSGSTTNFSLGSDGFVLKMDGSDDTMLAPIKTTSCEFTFVIEVGNTDQEAIVDDILSVAGDNEGELSLEIQRYQTGVGYRRFWIGVILGDLGELEDASPYNYLRVKAVDGLAQLKYKIFPESKAGNRSCLYYIKAALMEITTSQDEFGFWTAGSAETENFLTHQAFYYNKAMGDIDLSSWRDDLDHDPLALTKVNSLVFKNKDGQYWSYYKILENIVSAFQLRLMMTPIRDDSPSNGGSFYNGNCTWLLQSPLAYHGSSDNSNRDVTGHKFFLHGKQLTTDDALSYEDISHGVFNPKTHLAGGKQTFVPPLLSYKSIYDHKNFLAISMGPITMQTAWDNMTAVGASVTDDADGWEVARTEGTLAAFYQLTGFTDEEPLGWTGSDNDKSCNCRIVITGNATVHPKMHAYTASGGLVGYDSAGDYFNYYGGYALGNSWYGIDDDAYVMPRLGLRLDTLIADPDGNITIAGGDGTTFRKEAFWLGDARFGILAGSTPWARRDEGVYPAEDLKFSAGEDFTYPQNLYGYNGSWYGSRYWPNFPDNTSYIVNGVQQWGTDIGYSQMYWWRTGSPQATLQEPTQQYLHAFFSPIYFKADVTARNGAVSSSSWNDFVWQGEASDFIHTETFVVTSPKIPIGKALGDGAVGANYLSRISLYGLMHCDDATTPAGSQQRAACKSWDYSVLDTGGATTGGFGCEARGIQWDYYLSDVRVNVTGIDAGANSFDTTIAWYQNDNGSPSEQYVQEPEIVIGDNPPEDPFAWNESSGTLGFGGQYPGTFKIVTTANSTDLPEVGPDTQNWRAIWEVGAAVAGSTLHQQRAKNAIAHYYMIKRGLELVFSDRTSTKEIEQKLASGVYYYATGNRWGKNQENANIAFLITGFQFVAGTGAITVSFEDATTFSRSNLTELTYATNG
tara:strand:- start:9045 stop:11864 length:2820 start_codon:yes stop_codon:yes gene_type:complete